MEGLVTALLLAVQAVNGQGPVIECCATKTVGDYSYTRVDAYPSLPDTCLDPCYYSRDDQPGGTLYCFTTGSLPVKCLDDKIDVTVGPWGNFSGPNSTFSDKDAAFGEVSDISIFTGAFGPFPIVVLGIAISYGGDLPQTHGTTDGPNVTETKCKANTDEFFGGVKGRSFNLQKEGTANLIFDLEFLSTFNTRICASPSASDGNPKNGTFPSGETKLKFISGTMTDNAQAAIGSITFHFKNEK